LLSVSQEGQLLGMNPAQSLDDFLLLQFAHNNEPDKKNLIANPWPAVDAAQRTVQRVLVV
jgi:hypothetical protein